MDSWRKAIIEEAQDWLRTPWRHRARVKGAGVDCAQFLIGVHAGAGLIDDFDTGPYPEDWMLHGDSELFLPFIERYMKQVDAPQPADVALWRFGRGFSHAAIVIDYPRIIHAYRREGAVVYGDASTHELSRRPCLFYSLKVQP